MGRNIDLTKPLSEEDEAWLYDRARGWQVDENKRLLADKENKGACISSYCSQFISTQPSFTWLLYEMKGKEWTPCKDTEN